MKMIEDIGVAESVLKNIQENIASDSVESSNEIRNDVQNFESELANTSNLSECKIEQLETLKHVNNFLHENLTPSKEGDLMLKSDPIIEANDITSHGLSTFAPERRCPSPLLFTPVKGEETYGAGLLSQSVPFQVTPTTAEKVRSTPKSLPPLFCTPSPKLSSKSTTELHGVSHVFVGMKRSNQHCANGNLDESNNKPSTNSELQVKHSRSEYIISPIKSNESPQQTHNLILKKIEFPVISPSPSKCFEQSKVTAAQIDSSPSISECSDSAVFITPQKEEKINVVAQQLEVAHQNKQIRTKRKHRLRTLVSRARHSLSGIPPPPSFTIPQINVGEMLLKLGNGAVFVSFGGHAGAALCSPVNTLKNTENIDSQSASLRDGIQCNLGTNDITSSKVDDIKNKRDSTDSMRSHGSVVETREEVGHSPTLKLQGMHNEKNCEPRSLFHPSASEMEITDMTWPAVLDCVHLGVCYNLGTSSEALEELCQQVREKYVGNETASSCTIWSACNASERSSPRKRKNSNSQSNTQVREGYMMRRRRAFSLATLSSTIPSMATKSRQILVSKVTKLSGESKKSKKVVEEGSSKGRSLCNDGPKMSLLNKFLEGQEGTSNKLKRSYSFNDSTASRQMPSSTESDQSSSFLSHSSKLMSTKRVLQFDRLPRAASSPSLNASSSQSKLGASELSSQKSCDNIAVLNNTPGQTKNLPSHSVGTVGKDLSEVHKKKLLWAVAEALRSRGLGTGHEQFKSCAMPLFRCCRDAFVALPSVGTGVSINRSSEENSSERACDVKLNGSTDSQKERTSDKMLNIALQLVDKVMNEVGVKPVIKDK